ncbi:MAG: CTP synthase [Deltaproteobacteria bacterium]|jgi:CTP synthase|nr:CTP synthase [Deltaproteobacteria bacterium]
MTHFHEEPDLQAISTNTELVNQYIIRNTRTKFIFVTGGVISSLGKGVAGASLGALLKSKGFKVSMQKLDPYLNTDAGTMNPQQHGEVYVTDDGAETDMDLGHYERFLDVHLPQNSCFTSGYIYTQVIQKERKGKYYEGETIQIVPHITEEIKHYILRQTYGPAPPDVVIVEIGGTVGDIEGLPFCEAVHELRRQLHKSRSIGIHLTYVPYLESSGETKTKPTQHSVKELRAVGLQPDIIICRCQKEVAPDSKRKIAKSCGIMDNCVFTSPDVDTIYELPAHFRDQSLVEKVCQLLKLGKGAPVNIAPLTQFTASLSKLKKKVKIFVIGKYVDQNKTKGAQAREKDENKKAQIYRESYKSVHEALCHAGVKLNSQVEIVYLESSELNGANAAQKLADCGGALIPGGFGQRGTAELISVIQYLRESQIPFFGICLGLQLAVIEFARHVLKIRGVNSEEFNPKCRKAKKNVIYLMESWYEYREGKLAIRDEDTEKGGTMRLGLKPCLLTPKTKAYDVYRGVYDRANRRAEEAFRYLEVPLGESELVFPKAINNLDPQSLKATEAEIATRKLMTIYERHRHRYEINPQFHELLTTPREGQDHFVISGEAPKFKVGDSPEPPRIAEIMELKRHPWFVGCQFHPEFLSRPLRPHPLFLGFIEAALKFQERAKPQLESVAAGEKAPAAPRTEP